MILFLDNEDLESNLDNITMENLMKEDAISELKEKNLDLTRDALENEEKYLSQFAKTNNLQRLHEQKCDKLKSQLRFDLYLNTIFNSSHNKIML